MTNLFIQFKEKLIELSSLNSSLALLHWDREVNMPKKAVLSRAQTTSVLAGIIHEKFLSAEFEKLLVELRKHFDDGKLNPEESAIVREVWREFERAKRLPTEFIKELTRITSEAHSVWVEARAKSDFDKFTPHLKRIVELKREEAKLLSYKTSPYDALIQGFEPYATAEDFSIMFEELKDFLVPFIKKIQASQIKINRNILKGDFPIEKQIEFNKGVAEKIGYDLEAGRIDAISAHPFTIHFHPQDVRFTTRYNKTDILPALMTTLHEAGHALYEQGILVENFGTPLGESISLGVHESQSRSWENLIGRGKSFWIYLYPQLRKEFPEPFASISLGSFYQALNCVEPSFIRVEADEVTYNLHIILRFEIEKELIEGSVEVDDLPKIWNDKFKEYFGLEIPDDSLGVLQDVHWSGGSIGYFPTYTLGNLYAAQFYSASKRDIPDLEEQIARGEFTNFLQWLRENIHIRGKLYTARDLVVQVTGEPLKSQYFMDYLQKKYSEIYKL